MKFRKSPPYFLATMFMFSSHLLRGNKSSKSRQCPQQSNTIFYNSTNQALHLQIFNRKNQPIVSTMIKPYEKLSLFLNNFYKIFVNGKSHPPSKNSYTFV